MPPAIDVRLINDEAEAVLAVLAKRDAHFLYLDPTARREKFENTLAHELRHIGYSSSFPSPDATREIAALPPYPRGVVRLIGMFGEGFAALASAGGPTIHPHAVSNAEARARWDWDVADFNRAGLRAGETD